MRYNYNKLKGRIKEIYGTQYDFAKALGIGRVTLSKKLNCKIEFTQSEIRNTCYVLKINTTDIPNFFFTTDV